MRIRLRSLMARSSRSAASSRPSRGTGSRRGPSTASTSWARKPRDQSMEATTGGTDSPSTIGAISPGGPGGRTCTRVGGLRGVVLPVWVASLPDRACLPASTGLAGIGLHASGSGAARRFTVGNDRPLAEGFAAGDCGAAFELGEAFAQVAELSASCNPAGEARQPAQQGAYPQCSHDRECGWHGNEEGQDDIEVIHVVQQDEVEDGCNEQHDLEQANGFQQRTSAKEFTSRTVVAPPCGTEMRLR